MDKILELLIAYTLDYFSSYTIIDQQTTLDDNDYSKAISYDFYLLNLSNMITVSYDVLCNDKFAIWMLPYDVREVINEDHWQFLFEVQIINNKVIKLGEI